MTTELLEAPAAVAGKLVLKLKDLQRALHTIKPAVPGASCAIPALRSIHVQPHDGRVLIGGSDLEIGIEVSIPGGWESGSAFYLNADRVMNYVKLLEGDEVSFWPKGRVISLSCGRSRVNLLTFSAAPRWSMPELSDGILIPREPFLRALRFASMAIGATEGRYTLSGALMEAEGSNLAIVSTDGHRLVRYLIPFSGAAIAPILLPAKLIDAILSAADDKDESPIELCSNDSVIGVRLGGDCPVAIACKRIAGTFPNYKAALPKDQKLSIRLSAPEVAAAMARSTLMAEKLSQAIEMRFSSDALQLHSVESGTGESEERLTIQGPAEELRIGFRGEYVLDALRMLDGETVVGINDGQSAMTITATPVEREEFLYVVMPMRLHEVSK